MKSWGWSPYDVMNALIRRGRDIRDSFPFHVRIKWKSNCHKPGRGSSTSTEFARTLISDFPPSGTLKNKCLLYFLTASQANTPFLTKCNWWCSHFKLLWVLRMGHTLSAPGLFICWSPYLGHLSLQLLHSFWSISMYHLDLSLDSLSFRKSSFWMDPSPTYTHIYTRSIGLEFSFKCSNPSIYNMLLEGKNIILLIMSSYIGN